MTPIVPAIIPQSKEYLKEKLAAVSFAHEVQLDLIDGQFDDDVSWPYDPVGDPASVKGLVESVCLEVDLMVADPLTAADAWQAVGADMLVFHLESLSLTDFRQFEASTKISIGISAHGATTTEAILEYAQFADYVQLMGVYQIGAQGQPFDQTVIDKIKAVKTAFPHKMISIDGHVGPDTIVRLRDAGADRFVVGSAIVLQDDPAAAHAALADLLA